MANTIAKYVLNSAAGNLLDLRLKYGSLSLAGQTAMITGSVGVDYVYATAGMSVDFSSGGGGADVMYLDGAFADYSIGVSGTVVTLTKGLDTYKLDSTTSQKFVFSNGSITAADLVGGLSALNTSENSLQLPGSVATTSAADKVSFSTSGVITAAAGMGKLTISGSSGVDQVFIKAGAQADTTLLGGSTDIIWFTGNWADYTKTSTPNSNILTFTRTIDGKSESVTVVGGTGILNDKLVFADGYIFSKDALANKGAANLDAAGGKMSTTANEFTDATLLGNVSFDNDGQAGTNFQNLSISSDTGAADFVTSNASQTISGSYTGTLEDGDRIRIQLNNSGTWTDAVIDRATRTFTFAGQTLAQGVNTVKVELLSANGVTLEAGREHAITLGTGATITLDNTAPSGTISFVAAPDGYLNSAEVGDAAYTSIPIKLTLDATAKAGDTVQIKLNGSDAGTPYTLTATDVAKGTVLVNVPKASLPTDGNYAVTALFTDPAGNTSTAAGISIIRDTNGPASTFKVSTVDETLAHNALPSTKTDAFLNSSETDIVFEITEDAAKPWVDGDKIQIFNPVTKALVGTPYTIVTGDHPGAAGTNKVYLKVNKSDIGTVDGTYQLSVRTYDAAGNTNENTLDNSSIVSTVTQPLNAITLDSTGISAKLSVATVQADGSSAPNTTTGSVQSTDKFLSSTEDTVVIKVDSTAFGTHTALKKGDTVTLQIEDPLNPGTFSNLGTYTATVGTDDVADGDGAGNAIYFTVNKADLVPGATSIIRAELKDTAGNVTVGQNKLSLTVQGDITLTLDPNAALAGNELEVTSAIVLTSSQSLASAAHVKITITNNSVTSGFDGQTTGNTIEVYADDTRYVSISGSKVTITPPWDFDFGSNYTVTVGAGAFSTAPDAANGIPALGTKVVAAGDNLKFNTISLAGATDTTTAVQGHTMDSVTGLITTTGAKKWFALDPNAAAPYDLNGGDYAVVFKDMDPNGGNSNINDGVAAKDFNLTVNNFGSSDLIYVDDQKNDKTNINDKTLTQVLDLLGDGSSVMLHFDPDTTNPLSNFLGGNLTLNGTGLTSSGVLNQINVSNTKAVTTTITSIDRVDSTGAIVAPNLVVGKSVTNSQPMGVKLTAAFKSGDKVQLVYVDANNVVQNLGTSYIATTADQTNGYVKLSVLRSDLGLLPAQEGFNKIFAQVTNTSGGVSFSALLGGDNGIFVDSIAPTPTVEIQAGQDQYVTTNETGVDLVVKATRLKVGDTLKLLAADGTQVAGTSTVTINAANVQSDVVFTVTKASGALALGANTFTVSSTDSAGNQGTSQVTITRNEYVAYNGTVGLGPVVAGNDLQVTAYDKDGNVLATSNVSASGTYSLSIDKAYTGKAVTLRVANKTASTASADYRDESTNTSTDIGTSSIAAVVVADGTSQTVHITALTDLVARQLTVNNVLTGTTDQVKAYNLQLASTLGLSATQDITNILPTFVVDASGNATLSVGGKYGQLLAQMSDQQKNGVLSLDATQNTLANGITWTWDAVGKVATATVSGDMAKQVVMLAKVAQAAALSTGSSATPYLSDTDLSGYGITGVSGLTAARKANLLQRIVNSADDGSAYDTVSELQLLADKVVALAKIQDYANNPSTAPAPTTTDYTTAGILGVTATNLTAVNAKMAASAVTGTVPDDGLIQSVASLGQAFQVAAVAKITAYANDSTTNPAPTVANYATAGVVGVTTDNLAVVNAKVDADNALNGSSTVANVQTTVDGAVASYNTALDLVRAYIRDAVANTAPDADTFASLGLSSIASNDQVASAKFYLSQVMTPASADLSGSSLAASLTAQQTALAKINNYAVSNTNPAPTVADYVAAGITAANSSILAQLNAAVDGELDNTITGAIELSTLLSPQFAGVPSLSSIVRAGSSVVNGAFQNDAYLNAAELGAGATAKFTVTFDRAVSGVAVSNFDLSDASGNALAGASPTYTVASADGGAGKLWTVTVSNLNGLTSNGLRVNLANNTGITDVLSGKSLSVSTYTAGQSYTVDKVNTLTLAAASGENLDLTSTETSVNLYVDPANLTLGDTLKLTKADGTQLGGTVTVTASHLSNGVTFNVLKSSLANGNNVITVHSVDAAGNPATATATVTVGEYVQVTGILGLPSKVLGTNDLKVTAYDASNNVLGTGTIDATTNTYTLQLLKSATGKVKLQLTSSSTGKDFYDEATALTTDLGSMAISATITADGTAKTANITLLTDLASRLIDGITTPTAAQISAANLAVTKLLLNSSSTTDITAYTPDFGITNAGVYTTSTASLYGQLLSQLSQQAATKGRALDVVLEDLAAGIAYNSGTGVATLNNAFAKEVFMLAKVQMAAALSTGTVLSPTSTLLTVQDLIDGGVTGLSGLSTARKADLIARIVNSSDDGNAFDTLAEVQAVADQVVALGKIQDYATLNTNAAPTVADYSAAGITGVTDSNLAAVNARIDATDAAGTTNSSLIQAVVSNGITDNTTALAKIGDYANANTNAAPTVADYAAAGVTGVTAANLTAVNAKVDAEVQANASSTAKIQTLANAGSAAYTDAITILKNYIASGATAEVPTATTYRDAGLPTIDTAAEVANANYYLDQVYPDASSTLPAATILAALTAQQTAMAKIDAYAADNTKSMPSIADYTAAGIAGVNTNNLSAINTIVDGYAGATASTNTTAGLKAAISTLFTLQPTLTSITTAGTSVVNGAYQTDSIINAPELAASVKFTVTFDRAVTGLSASNFKLVDASGILVAGVPSPTYTITTTDDKVYTVTVGGLGSMTSNSLRLDFANNTGVTDKVSGQVPLTNTFTTGSSYTVDTTYNSTVVAAAGEDLILDSGESAANIFVDASKLAVGDTLTLKLTSGATLATATVSAADITAGGVTLTALKSALTSPAPGATSDVSNAITLVHADTAGNLSSVNSAIVVSRTVTVSGTIGLGPVVSTADLLVTAYDSTGKNLGTATVNTSTGQYSLAISRSYTGPVVLRLSSTGSGADYRDEASNANVDLGTSNISAVISADGSNKTAHITALTDIAARMVTVSGGMLASGVTAAKVDAANLLVTKQFVDSTSAQGITAVTPDFSVTTTGAINTTASRYGQLLAGLSKQALDSGAGLAYTQATVANSITFNFDSTTPANSTMTLGQAAKDTVFLAKVAQAAALASTATVGSFLTTADLTGFSNFSSLSAARQSDVITRVVNGSDDGTLTNTVAKVQALIDKVKAIGVIQDYKNAVVGAATPTVDVYVTAGFSAVNSDNLATVNSAVLAAAGDVNTSPDTIIGAAVTTGTSLQSTALGIVTAYATANTNALPTVQNYADAGITGVTATNLAAVNAKIDAKVAADVNTIALAQAVVDTGIVANTDAITAIKSYAANSASNAAPTLTTYRDAGLAAITTSTQVDNANYLLSKVLSGTSPSTSTLSTKLAAQITAINKIDAYALDNTKPVPAVSDYTDAGFSQVTASNLSEINKRVDSTTAMNNTTNLLGLLRAMDLDSATSDTQTSASIATGSGISVGRPVFASVNKTFTDDIASIKVAVTGTIDAANDQIAFGSVSHALDSNALTGTSITINGVSGIDWAYSSNQQLRLTKTDGTAFTAAEAQAIEQGIRFVSTSTTSGSRVFTINHTGTDGVNSASAATTVAMDTAVNAVDLDAGTAATQATGSTSLNATQAAAGKAIVGTTLATPTDTDIGTIKIVVGGSSGIADALMLNSTQSLTADFSASNVTIGGITGVSYTYNASTKTLLLSRTAGGAFTPANIPTLVAALKFQTGGSEEGTTRTFTISYIDTLGNASAAGVSTMTVDTSLTTPSLSLATDDGLSASDGYTTNALINVSGLDAGATWQYSTNGGTTWAAGTGSTIAAATFGAAGAKTVMVKATDAAGNTATSANYAFNLVAAPTQTATITTVTDDVATNGSVTGTVASGKSTDDNVLALSGTISAALTANQVVAIYDGATKLGNATVSSTSWTFNTAVLANGQHNLTARVENTVDKTFAASSPAYTVNVNAAGNLAINTTVDDAGGVTGTVTQTLVSTNYGAYLPTTSSVIFSGSGLNDIRDIDLVNTSFYTGGSYMGFESGLYSVQASSVTYSGNTSVTFWAIYFNGADQKAVKMQLTLVPATGNVSAVMLAAKSNTTAVNDLTFNFETSGTTQPVATSLATAGYGVSRTVLATYVGYTDDSTPTLRGTLAAALGTSEELAVYKVVAGTYTKLGVATVTGSSWSYTTSALSDGNQELIAMVQNVGDTTGTTGRVVSSGTYLNITSSAAAPTQTVTIASATDDVSTNGSATGALTSGRTTDDNVLALSGTVSTALGANLVVAVYDGATKLGNATVSGTSWTFSTPALSNASHSLTARVENTLNGTSGSSSSAFVANVNNSLTTTTIDDAGTVTGAVPAPSAVRYITLAHDVGDNAGNWVTEIADVMVYLNGSSTPVSLSSLGTASVVARAGDTTPNNILDGSSGTVFSTANDGNFKWLRVDLGGLYNITGVRIVAGSSAFANGVSVYTSTTDTVTGSALNYTSRANMDTSATVGNGLYKLGMTGAISAGASQDLVALSTTDDNKPTFNGTLPAALGTSEEVAVYSIATLTGTTTKLGVATVTGNTWTYTPGTALADGTYNIKVMVQNSGDSSGTTGRVVSTTSGLAINTSATAPTQTVTISSVSDDVATNGSTTGALTSGKTTDDSVLALAGTVSAALGVNQVLAVYDSTTKLGNATVSGTSWTFSTPALSNAVHSLTARVENAVNGSAGTASSAFVANVNNAMTMAITDDVGSITGALSTGAITDDSKPTFSGTLNTALGSSEEVAIYQTVGGTTTKIGAATVVGNGWTFTPTTALADGAYTFKAMVQNTGDSAGTTGRLVSASSTITVASSTTAPTQTASISTVTDDVSTNGSATGALTTGATTDDSALALSGTLSAALTANQVLAVYDGATKLGNATVSGTSWTYSTPTLSNAAHSLTARVENTVNGTSGSSSAAFVANVNTGMAISTIVDNVGSVTGSYATSAPVMARYIMVRKDQTSSPLSFNELQVMSDGVNVALGKTTTVGSQGNSLFVASNLVDGSTSNLSYYYPNNTTDPNAWIQVDLGATYPIQSVVLAPLSSAPVNLTNVFVYMSTTDMSGGVSSTTPSQAPSSTGGTTYLGVTSSDTLSAAQTLGLTTTDDSQPTLTGTLPAALGAGEELAIYQTSGGVNTKLGVATVTGNSWTFTPATALANGTYYFEAMVQKAGDTLGTTGRAVSRTIGLIIGTSTVPTQTTTITSVTDDVVTNGSVSGTLLSGTTTDDSVLALTGTISSVLSINQAVVVYDGTTKLGTATVTGTSWTFNTPALTNAQHTLTARVESTVTGAAAAPSAVHVVNVNNSLAMTVADDVGTVQGNLASGAATDDNKPTFSGTLTAAPGAGEEVAIYQTANGVTTRLGAATVTGSTWTYTPGTAIADGVYTFKAMVQPAGDTTGTLGRVVSASSTLTIDTAAAPSQTVTIVSVRDDVTSNGSTAGTLSTTNTTDDNTLSLSGTVSAPLTGSQVVAVYDGSTKLGNATMNGNLWTYTTGVLSNGSHNLTARVENVASGTQGTASTAFWANVNSSMGMNVIDAAGSIQGTLSTVAATDDNKPTFSGTLATLLGTNEEVVVYQTLNGVTTKLGTAIVSGYGWSYTPTTAISDGVYTFKAMVQPVGDTSGNLGRVVSASSTLTIDTSATPTQTVTIAAVADDATSNGSTVGALTTNTTTDDNTPTLSGTVSAALTGSQVVAVYDGATKLGHATMNGNLWTFTSGALSNGSHSLTARVENAATGTQGPASTAFVVNVNNNLTMNVADDVGAALGNLASGAATDDNKPTFSGTLPTALGTGEELAIYQTINGLTSRLGPATVTGSNWTFTPGTALADGVYTFKAMVQPTGDTTGTLGRVVSASSAITVSAALLTHLVTVVGATDDVATNGSTIGTVASNASTDDATPTLTGTLSAVLTGSQVLNVYEGTTLLGAANVVGQSWSFTTPVLSAGTHALVARVEDPASGQAGANSSAYTARVHSSLGMTLTDDVGATQGSVVTGTSSDDLRLSFSGTLSSPLAASGEDVAVYATNVATGVTTKVGITTVTGGTNWTCTQSSDMAAGTYVFKAMVQTAGDSSGATGRVVSQSTQVTLTASDTSFSAITSSDPVSGLNVKALSVAAGATLDMNNYTHSEVNVLNLGAGSTAKIDLGDVLQTTANLFTSTNFASGLKSGGLQQMVINGASTSSVVVQADAGGTTWAKSATSVTNSGHTYDVYNNSNGLAQLLIDQQVLRSGAVI